MGRRQADGRVHRDVLGGAVGCKDPCVGLIKEGGQRSDTLKDFIIKPPQTHSSLPYLVDEGLEEVGLVSERVVNQSVTEGHDAMRKVMLREPGHHTLLLHVRTTRYIYDQVAQILPVSARNNHTTEHSTSSGRALPWHLNASSSLAYSQLCGHQLTGNIQWNWTLLLAAAATSPQPP